MKKLFLAILLVIVVVLAYMLFNTFSMSSVQITADPVKAVEVPESAVAHLQKSLTYKTISYNDKEPDSVEFGGFHQHLKESYPLIDSMLDLTMISEYTLLYHWEGKNPDLDPIVILSHQDVVPVDTSTLDKWDEPPYSGNIRDGKIYGRGSLDDKVTVIATMEAVEMLLSTGFQPTRSIYLSFGHDEEIGGSNGARKVAEKFKEEGKRIAFVIDEGGFIAEGMVPGVDKPVAMINVAEKGYVTFELKVQTNGGHSSRPSRDNAIGMLSKAIVDLENNQMPYRMNSVLKKQLRAMGPELPFKERFAFANPWMFKDLILGAFWAKTTTAPTIFNSGVKNNVLPTEATARVNFRITPGETTEDVRNHIIKTIANDQITVETNGYVGDPSPLSTSPDAAPYKTIERTIRQLCQECIVTPGVVMGGTDAKHFYPISDNVLRFFPMRITPDNSSTFHGNNEHIYVDNYIEVIQYMHQLILNTEEMNMP